jgi:dTDP-4-amino-4,6-dideoxygalactose transaminase
VLRIAQRERFVAAMREAGIGTDVHYPVPDHRQSAYADPFAPTLPVTEAACQQVVSLPCFPGLAAADVERVISAVTRYLDSAR